MVMKYYLVYVKCGHVGRNRYIVKWFPICAANKKEASKIAINKGRVKHHDKKVVQDIKEIRKEEFYEQIKVFNDDNFHKVHSIQEQRELCPNIYLETHKEEDYETYKRTNIRRHLVDRQIAKEMERNKHNYDVE